MRCLGAGWCFGGWGERGVGCFQRETSPFLPAPRAAPPVCSPWGRAAPGEVAWAAAGVPGTCPVVPVLPGGV